MEKIPWPSTTCGKNLFLFQLFQLLAKLSLIILLKLLN